MDRQVPLTAAEREALRADARETRERARTIAAEALRMRAAASAQLANAEARVAASKEHRDRLRAMVVKHARITRALGESPEQAILEAKNLATEAVEEAKASVRDVEPREARALRDDLVRWTIDAYFGVGL